MIMNNNNNIKISINDILKNKVHMLIIEENKSYNKKLKNEIKTNPYIVYKYKKVYKKKNQYYYSGGDKRCLNDNDLNDNEKYNYKKKNEKKQKNNKNINYNYKYKIKEITRYAINLNKISYSLSSACNFLFYASSQKQSILFIGIGEFIEKLLIEASLKTRSHYIVNKWLYGFLTNWSTTEKKLYELRNWEITNSNRNIIHRFLISSKGIRYMTQIPEIVIIIIDQKNNKYIEQVLKECFQLNIYTICCISSRYHYYSDLADIFIPINTESIESTFFVLNKFVYSIIIGKKSIIKNADSILKT
uniref:Ribosomal protein S2 n=1 Tax=Hydnora visseri TaxID=1329980 RepID=A0A0X9MAT0_HYDVS|nr:ribosomal protein S2 [Hydnora visseri]ALZ49994.1 ribosomal protein S2 [Hydnora visseri]